MCITDLKSPTQGQHHKIVSEIYYSRIHEADGWRDAAFHTTFFLSVPIKLRKNLGMSNVFPKDVWRLAGS